MLVIRLRRIGKKNNPSYRIVVAEHSFPIDGRFVEDLGFYNPHTKNVGLNKEKAIEWMKKGAQPSNTIAKILEKEKVKHSSVVVTKKSRKPKKVAEEKPATPTASPAPEEQAPEAEAPDSGVENEELKPAEAEEGVSEVSAETPPTEESAA